MAPEQHRGGAIDARSDQFAFCLTLFEALHGERPFAGDDPAQLLESIEAGRVRGGDAEVPAWVRRAVLRGLSPRPEDRHPSMQALLAELARDPRRTRRRAAMALGVVAIAGGAAAMAWARAPADLCAGAARHLAGVWDEAVKGQVHAAFSATGMPYAEAAWRGSGEKLDGYAAGWVSAHRDACEATRRRGEQSERALDLRMACLAGRRTELAALAGLFARADATVVSKSVAAASSLPALDECADVERLSMPSPLPGNAVARAQIGAVRAQLAAAAAFRAAGKFTLGLALAAPLVAAARATGYKPVEAEALSTVGHLRFDAGDSVAAEKTLFDAVVVASAGGAAEVEADARAELVPVLASLSRYDDALRSVELAGAILQRLGGDEGRQGRLLCLEGNIRFWKDELVAAQARYARGLELLRRQPEPSVHVLAPCLRGLGVVAGRRRRDEESFAYHAETLELARRTLGPDHPEVARALVNMGQVRLGQHRTDEAIELLGRALAIQERALPAAHPSIAIALLNLGSVYLVKGELDGARERYLRALAIAEKVSPKDVVAELHGALGMVYRRQGKYEQALEEHRQALALNQEAFGPEHQEVAGSLNEIGVVLARQGQRQAALEQFRLALAIVEKTLGSDSHEAGGILSEMGDTLSAMGQHAAGLERLERAHAILEKLLGPRHRDVGMSSVRIGQALARAGKPAAALLRFERSASIFETTGSDDDRGTAFLGVGTSRLALGQAKAAIAPLERAVGLGTAEALAPLARARRRAER
jgi:tetratricopeptide (TPR) repeat protein